MVRETTNSHRSELGMVVALGLIVGAVLLLIGVRTAFASSPGDAIVFCANPAGQARIVAAESDCRTNETPHTVASSASAMAIDTRVAALEADAATSAARVASLESRATVNEGRITSLESEVDALGVHLADLRAEIVRLDETIVRATDALEARLTATILALDAKVDDGLSTLRTDLNGLIDALAAEFIVLEGRVDAFGAQTVAISDRIRTYDEMFDGVDRFGSTLVFEGMNVQLINGTRDTHTGNGTGNLILGYNVTPAGVDRAGSHNLVIGDNHNYSIGATGAIVAGDGNTISAQGASILGGTDNANGADGSVIVTGEMNVALGGTARVSSAILGGADNTVQAGGVIVSGTRNSAAGGGVVVAGDSNEAEFGGVVVSGSSNDAIGGIVIGGLVNEAQGGIVVGGYRNSALAPNAVILTGSNSFMRSTTGGLVLEAQYVLLQGTAKDIVLGGPPAAYYGNLEPR